MSLIDISSLSADAQAAVYMAQQGMQQRGGQGRGRQTRGRGMRRGNNNNQNRGGRGGFQASGYSSGEESGNERGSGSAQRGASEPRGFTTRGRGNQQRSQSQGANSKRLPPKPDSVYNVWALADGISQAIWKDIISNDKIRPEMRFFIFQDRIRVMRYFGHTFRSPMTMFRGFHSVTFDEAEDIDDRQEVDLPNNGGKALMATATWIFKTRYAIDPARKLPAEPVSYMEDFFDINDSNRPATIRAGAPYLRVFDRLAYEGYARLFEKAALLETSQRPGLFKGYRHDANGKLMARSNSRAGTPGTMTPASSTESLNAEY